jgi:hypothetical protein
MRNWLIDIGAALIWAGAVVLLVVNADESSGEVLIPLFIALCAALGFTSGRYRILLVPVAITLVGVTYQSQGVSVPTRVSSSR